MKKLVGIKALPEFSLPLLKREALLFNQIAITHVDYLIPIYLGRVEKHPLHAELEWLREQEIISEAYLELRQNLLETNEELKALYACAKKSHQQYIISLKDLIRKTKNTKPADEYLWSEFRKAASFSTISDAHLIRQLCVQHRVQLGVDACPLLPVLPEHTVDNHHPKVAAITVVLNALPVPDEATPWEQIIEYRNDPNSRRKFLALRNWMSEVARAELSPTEVEEKLEYLVSQYQQHMELHRMKTNVGTLETIVTTGAEVLGDLVSFKWGKAAEALFSLKRRQVALLEGELSAPGNEIAYIVKARGAFS